MFTDRWLRNGLARRGRKTFQEIKIDSSEDSLKDVEKSFHLT